MKKKRKKKSYFQKIMEPFDMFYLGFLTSVGLSFGSAILFSTLRQAIEFYTGLEILVYSRIGFSIFYIFFLIYTYYILDMKKRKSLRNGFFLFTFIYILAQIYVWVINSIK